MMHSITNLVRKSSSLKNAVIQVPPEHVVKAAKKTC
jgi:hypothetical protein